MNINEIHINPLFHARARFLVMLLLLQKREYPFLQVAKDVRLTKGNLSIQARKLEKAGYIEITKAVVNNYSHTICKVTSSGISAFKEYCLILEKAILLCKGHAPDQDYFELTINGKKTQLAISSIEYLESWGNYVRLYSDGKMFLTKSTTRQLEEKLPHEVFMRVHRSYIVNKSKIGEVNTDEIIIGTARIPIGKTYKRYVIEFKCI